MARPKLNHWLMRPQTKVRLAQSARGRVVLHLLTLWRDGRIGWHLAGVLREFRRVDK